MSQYLFAEGHAVPAQYHVPVVREYRGNPFIEALPPTLGRDDAKRAMAYFPEYDEKDRLAAGIEREHMASLLSAVRQPVGLHAELHSRLSRLIRNGYVARNPMRPFFQPNIDARERALRVEGKGRDLLVTGAYSLGVGPRPSATGLTFLGLSGIGKSAAVEMCLSLYPQLLVHSEYKGQPFPRTQVVWLRLDAPPDGSILTLAERFFTAMDTLHAALDIPTDYRTEYMPARSTIHRVIPRMARLAAQHGLGVLVLDEIQDLNPRGSRAVLSFLVQLVNTVGIPVVLVGGIDALPLLNEQFRQARRGASEGDLIVRRAELGRDWRAFCEVLWRYQYTRYPTELNDTHIEALYEVSQGITQYLVLAYKLAQVRAIATGIERVTPNLIKSVRDSLAQAAPVLAALRRGNTEVLRRLGDVMVPEGFEGVPFVRGDRPAVASGQPVDARGVTGADSPVTSAAAAAQSDSPPALSREKRPRRRTKATAGEHEIASQGSDGRSPCEGAAPSTFQESLPEIARAAREAGQGAHAALVEAGVIADATWNHLLDPAGGRPPEQ